MTAATSQHLANVLRDAGFEGLAERAETDEFHDFLSNHALPDLVLDQELALLVERGKTPGERMAAHNIRMRHHDGEFDADLAESDDWAASEEGQAAFAALVRKERP